MGVIDGDISNYIRSQWTIVAMMLIVIWLSIFFVKTYFFNDKIYYHQPYLKNDTNKKDLLSLLNKGLVIFMLLLISWNINILYSIIGILVLAFILGGIIYGIQYFKPLEK